jgi:hypothetical protein
MSEDIITDDRAEQCDCIVTYTISIANKASSTSTGQDTGVPTAGRPVTDTASSISIDGELISMSVADEETCTLHTGCARSGACANYQFIGTGDGGMSLLRINVLSRILKIAWTCAKTCLQLRPSPLDPNCYQDKHLQNGAHATHMLVAQITLQEPWLFLGVISSSTTRATQREKAYACTSRPRGCLGQNETWTG